MKRKLSLFLILTLLLSLTACAQSAPGETGVIATATPTQAETTAEADGVYTVSTADEFIAAIGSDREIRLKAGTIDLSAASTYGGDTGNENCVWQEEFDGFQLIIRNVKNLTVTGEGKDKVVFSVEPRYAQVLTLDNCSNISLTGFTAGHTREPGACAGGVIYLSHSTGISLRNVGLYGCGVTGVTADDCTNVTVANSDIYECSYNGVYFHNSHGMSVLNCRFYQLGGGESGAAAEVFSVYGSFDVTISDCEIYDNYCESLMNSSGSDGVRLKDNVFHDNTVRSAAFGTFGNFLVMDGNSFENCTISRWFADGCGAMDAQGYAIDEDTMRGIAADDMVPEETVEPTSVTVTNADEFLEAIGSNTEIIIDTDLIDFSTAKEYGGAPHKYYRWVDNFDGPGLVIESVRHLTIRTKDRKPKNHTISATPRYADVLYFSNCDDIVLDGFTAGHTKEPGECVGGVLNFQNCTNVSVSNCGLFGCGILGVQAQGCTQISLRSCDIYECSYGGVSMSSTTGVKIDACTFRDLGGNNLMLSDCSDVTVDGEPLNGSYYNGR